jgi:hypothetical protein
LKHSAKEGRNESAANRRRLKLKAENSKINPTDTAGAKQAFPPIKPIQSGGKKIFFDKKNIFVVAFVKPFVYLAS